MFGPERGRDRDLLHQVEVRKILIQGKQCELLQAPVSFLKCIVGTWSSLVEIGCAADSLRCEGMASGRWSSFSD